jgi:hypothetical protein
VSDIALVDTSIFLNVLDIPNNNQNRNEVIVRFREMITAGDYLLVPMATIWETGNHIAHLPDGGDRYRFAQKLVDEVNNIFDGKRPWSPTFFPESAIFRLWIQDFPASATKSKSASKTREGTSLADHLIIKEWEATCIRHHMSRVFIWSLDGDLKGYDTGAPR